MIVQQYELDTESILIHLTKIINDSLKKHQSQNSNTDTSSLVKALDIGIIQDKTHAKILVDKIANSLQEHAENLKTLKINLPILRTISNEDLVELGFDINTTGTLRLTSLQLKQFNKFKKSIIALDLKTRESYKTLNKVLATLDDSSMDVYCSSVYDDIFSYIVHLAKQHKGDLHKTETISTIIEIWYRLIEINLFFAETAKVNAPDLKTKNEIQDIINEFHKKQYYISQQAYDQLVDRENILINSEDISLENYTTEELLLNATKQADELLDQQEQDKLLGLEEYESTNSDLDKSINQAKQQTLKDQDNKILTLKTYQISSDQQYQHILLHTDYKDKESKIAVYHTNTLMQLFISLVTTISIVMLGSIIIKNKLYLGLYKKQQMISNTNKVIARR